MLKARIIFVSVTLMLMSTVLMFTSCKKPKDENNTSPVASTTTVSTETILETDLQTKEAQVQQYLDDLKTQHLDFEAEYKAVVKAVEDYKTSDVYTNPTNDTQKLVSLLADMLSGLSIDSAKQGLISRIKSHDFNQYGNVFANMGSYREEIQSFVTEAASLVNKNNSVETPPPEPTTVTVFQTDTLVQKQTDTVTAHDTTTETITVHDTTTETIVTTDTDVGDQTATDTTQGKTLNKYFLYASAGFLFVLTGFAGYHVAKRGKQIVQADKGSYSKNFVKNFAFDSALLMKTGALVFFGVMITMGLVNDGKVDSEYLRDPALALGILSGITAVYWTFEVAMNARGEKGKIGAGDVTSKGATATYDPKRYYKLNFVESIRENKGNMWEESGGGKKTNYAKSAAGIVAMTVLSVGSIYAYKELQLEDNRTADQTLISKIMRFFAVCDILSESGALVLN
jgi:hypothetical protein